MYKTYHYDNMPIMRGNTTGSSGAPQKPAEPPMQSVPLPRAPAPPPKQSAPAVQHVHREAGADNGGILHNFFGNLNNDDIILLVIIFILLLDDCEDKLLLAALGFIFFSGLGEK